MIRGEAAAAIHSLAAEAVAFQESLQRLHLPADQGAQPKGTKGKATVAARMIDLIKDPATHTWTAEQFRLKVGCKSAQQSLTRPHGSNWRLPENRAIAERPTSLR